MYSFWDFFPNRCFLVEDIPSIITEDNGKTFYIKLFLEINFCHHMFAS